MGEVLALIFIALLFFIIIIIFGFVITVPLRECIRNAFAAQNKLIEKQTNILNDIKNIITRKTNENNLS